jgi:hypothetical protein
MITGTYDLIADPSWALLQFQEVRLECDTTLGPVTINLPLISTLAISTNLKLFIVDATSNANANNITINSDGTDIFNDSTTNTLILNVDSESVEIQNVTRNVWLANLSASSSSAAISTNESLIGFGTVLNPLGVNIEVTNIYYVDPANTNTYTPTGSVILPFFTITDAVNKAITDGHDDTNPAYIVLTGNITENVDLFQGGIWLTSAYGTGTHGSPNLTGKIRISGNAATTFENHFSISNLRIIAPTNEPGIVLTGSNGTKLFMSNLWIDASGTTGTCCTIDNSNPRSTMHMNTAHLTHSGTGDVYCIDCITGTTTMTDIETSGNVQVAAVRAGATLALDSSEIDGDNNAAIEVYGGTLTVTRSLLTNAQADGHGVALNDPGSVLIIGETAISVPVSGTGKAIYGVAGTFCFYQYLTFINPINPAAVANNTKSLDVTALPLETALIV